MGLIPDPIAAGQAAVGNPSVALPPNLSPQAMQIIQGQGTMNQNTVTPLTGQPSSTPLIDDGTSEFSVDAFRNGGVTNPAGTDPLIFDRVLSDDVSDEDAASIWITAQTGSNPTDFVSAYGRFFLTDFSEPEQEKFQVVETFTAFYVYFYGRKPAFYRYSGILLNDPNFRWTNDFRFMYDNYFSGTAAADLDATALIQYDGKQVSCMVVGMSIQQNSSNPKGCPFSIDVLVLDYTINQFSSDIAGLIAQKQADLVAQKATIAAQMAQINKNIPQAQVLTANQVFSGNLPAASVSPTTASPTSVTPPSLQANAFTSGQ